MEVGFIGLGRMGAPMAANLLRGGHRLTVYNRSPRPQVEELRRGGAAVADSPQAVAEASRVVFTMLSDNRAVEETVWGTGGVLEGLSAGKILVDSSTVAPALARRLAAACAAKGAQALDAPVAGSVPPAREGTLVFMVGGDEAAFREVEPLFGAMGKHAVHLGPSGRGLAAKLALNAFLGVTTAALAEAAAQAEGAGVSRDAFLELVGRSAVGASPYVALKLPLLRRREYPVAFSLDHIYKDLGLALEQAHAATVSAPATAAAWAAFAQARARGWGGQDLMAVARLWEGEADDGER
ncbi:MAG: NAD(P)-dependent oxidoreductase [Thermaerobacter sp.]|nr:NAD(P)-dependent oxidoreductase [Thermaerobacter sp.]